MSARRVAASAAVLAALVMGCASGPVSQASFFSDSATIGPSDTVPSGPPGSAAPEPPASGPLASSSPSPSTSTAPGAAGAPPPRPGHPTFTLVDTKADPGGGSTVSYQVTWTEPEGVASRFLVYGLKVCLRDSAAFDGKPCIARHMAVPASQLDLLGEAPGAVRSITVSWRVPDGATGTGPYPSILMRASNDSGDSIFTIVHTENVCYRCGS